MPAARSLPSNKPFYGVIAFVFLQWIGLASTITAAVLSFFQPEPRVLAIMVGGLIFSGLMWMIGILKRRKVYCPLCRGTPLIDTQARVHTRASRIWPISHGMTAILSILATHQFRCMYCGTDYDMLKGPSKRRHARKHRH